MLTPHLFIRSSEPRFAHWSKIDSGKNLDHPRHTGNDWESSHFRTWRENAHSTYRAAFPTGHCHSETDTGNLRPPWAGIPRRPHPYKPISENTVNRELRLRGYDTKADDWGHGFRTKACSALVESELWSRVPWSGRCVTGQGVQEQVSTGTRSELFIAFIHCQTVFIIKLIYRRISAKLE